MSQMTKYVQSKTGQQIDGGGTKPDYKPSNLQGKVEVSFGTLEKLLTDFQAIRKAITSGNQQQVQQLVNNYEDMLANYVKKKKSAMMPLHLLQRHQGA